MLKARYIILLILITLLSPKGSSATEPDNNSDINSKVKFRKLAAVKHKLSKDTSAYFKHIIYVKTRNPELIAGDNKSFANSILNFLFEQNNVYKIDKPYEELFREGSKTHDYTGLSRICEIYYKSDLDPAEFCRQLENFDEVEYAAPVYKGKPCFVPDDSLYSKQDELQKIQSEKAWEITQGDTNTVIAIVDTEVDWQHEDLADNIFTNRGEIPGNGIDDDNNGKIDDVHGWDFVGGFYYDKYDSLIITEDNDTKIYDINSKLNHGTMVASCAAAVTNNGRGMASIANKCRILPVKIQGDDHIFWRGHDGILYAAMMKADVINCSWIGVGNSPVGADIVKQASLMGSLIVVAAGNSTFNNDDVDYMTDIFPYTLYVGSSNDRDSVAHFSNYGITTNVYAPGNPVYSAVPYNKYMTINGTSLSAPIVAGVAGLIRSVHHDWSVRQIWHQLRSTSDNIFYNNEPDKRALYFGRLNAYNAVAYNKTFFDSLSVPGIEFTEALIHSDNGRLNTFETVKMRLKIKNFLASAKNLKISFSNLDTLINTVNDTIAVDLLNNNDEKYIEFDVRLNPNTQWYEDFAKILVCYESGITTSSVNPLSNKVYTDYQLLKIPLQSPPKKYFDAKSGNNTTLKAGKDDLFIKDLSSANFNSVWACGVSSANRAFVLKADTNQIKNLFIFDTQYYSSAPKILAIDEKTAFVLIDQQYFRTALNKTIDGGISWKQIDVNKDIQYIKDIHFWDANNGILVCSDFVNRIVIYETNDNGNSWHGQDGFTHLNSSGKVLNSTNYTNSYFYRNKTLISIYPNLLLITSDRGNSWRVDSTVVPMFLGFQFLNDNDAVAIVYHYFDINEKWKETIARTNDGGNNWRIDSSFRFNKIFNYPACLYNNEMSGKLLLLGNNRTLMLSEDKADSWYPIKANIDGISGNSISLQATAFSDGKRIRLWISQNKLTHIDLDDIFNPIENNNEIAYHNVYPNPAGDELQIQFYISKQSFVSVKVYDILGREVGNIKLDNINQGQYHNILINSVSYPIGLYNYKIQTQTAEVNGNFMIVR